LEEQEVSPFKDCSKTGSSKEEKGGGPEVFSGKKISGRGLEVPGFRGNKKKGEAAAERGQK